MAASTQDSPAPTADLRTQQGPKIFVSVAEQSADEHAAMLIRALRKRHPDACVAGLAGAALRAEGVESYEDLTAQSAMALAAFKKIPWAIRLLRRVKNDYLRRLPFDAAVLVDSPALNLPIAKICQKLGIPVLYYIAPQTWAWGPPNWRNRRIRRRVNRLACIWPFEEPYFRKAGIAATYVGHPSFDRFKDVSVDETRIADLRGAASSVVTILPGSRPHVIQEVLPGQLEVAETLARRFSDIRILIVAANDSAHQQIQGQLARRAGDLPVSVVQGDAARAEAICAADLALVASGTVTLEVAYRATPMIVMYNSNRWFYEIVARRLIRTPWLSIPNIIAQREIVPEFMPYYTSTAPIADKAIEWLADPAARNRVRDDLKRTIEPLVGTGAADNAAAELLGLLRDTAKPQQRE